MRMRMLKDYANHLYYSKVKNEEGQGMVEYALIIGLVSVAAVAVLALIGPEIFRLFGDILDNLKKAEPLDPNQ